METVEFKGVTLNRWNCGPSTFLARPGLGARLMNWNVRMSDGSIRDVIYWPEGADFDNFAKVRGGNPILFPFSARTYDRGKIGFWRDKAGVVRPMPQHGFSRDGDFKITELCDTGFTATLSPDDAAHEAYPFDCTFSVQYVFDAVSFKVFLTLENSGNAPLLWSAGHHFYFSLPWHDGLERKDYRFEIPAKKCFTHASDGSLSPIKPFKNSDSFGNSEINDRIFTKLTGAEARLGPNGGEEDIGIRILNKPEDFPDALSNTQIVASTWNAFVVWTEHVDSPFYCVEPWMGPPNSPEHEKGLHAVNAGEKACFGVEVSLL